MKEVTFIVEQGKPDMQGDILKPSALKGLPKEVKIFKDFDTSLPPVGSATLFHDTTGDTIKAKATLDEALFDKCGALGFKIIEHINNEDGSITVTRADVYAVGLVEHNADTTIPPIKDQL
jgi:hypothetical protein